MTSGKVILTFAETHPQFTVDDLLPVTPWVVRKRIQMVCNSLVDTKRLRKVRVGLAGGGFLVGTDPERRTIYAKV